MKGKTVLITGMMIAVLALQIVSAADSFCFLSLHKGQKTSDNFFSCAHTTCQVCVNAATNAYATWNKCSESCNVVAPPAQNLILTANFPFADGGILTKQSFNMDITTNTISSIRLIDNVAGTTRILCPNCNSYKQSVTFKQGFNDITIRAVNGGSVKEKRITFFIDNKKPVISSTLPASNKFVTGTFSVIYTEDNVKEIKLSYGSTALGMRDAVLVGCSSGKKQNCSTDVDLKSYDGKDISYFFTVTDIAGNTVVSRAVKVKVDKTPPVINSMDYSIKKRSVTFNMSISESNFNKVEYVDNSGDGRWKVLCSSLSKGVCKKALNLQLGAHQIDIRVSDKAGNEVLKSIPEFEIV